MSGSADTVPGKASDVVDGRRLPWGLIAILVLAAVLRLSRLELVPMTNEMAGSGLTANVVVASSPSTGWPLAGALAEGVRGSSLFIYLVSLPNQLIWHPLTGVVLVALLNVWAVFLAYRLADRLFGHRAALAAGLLLACSPWAVVYSRQLWAGSCLAVVSLWLVGMSLTWLSKGGSGRLVRMLILGFLIPQLHYSGLAATAWLAVVIWIGRRRVSWSPTIAGVSFGLSTWTPWVAFHHIGGWTELRNSLSILDGKPNLARAIIDEINYLQSMLHSGSFDYWFAVSPADLPEFFPGWQRAVLAGCGLLMVVAVAAEAGRALTRTGDSSGQPGTGLLWLWVVLPLLGGLVYRPDVRPEHLLIVLPVLLVLAAAAAGRCLDGHRRTPRVLACGVLGTLAVSHVLFLVSWNSYLDDDLADPQGQYGLTFRQRRDVARWVLSDCDGQSVELAGPFRGGHPAYEYVYYYERSRSGRDRSAPEEKLKYWIDEDSDGGQPGTVVYRSLKQRQIGATLNRYQSTSSRWKIEKSHQLGATRIYRIRLPVVGSFRTAFWKSVSGFSEVWVNVADDFLQRSRWRIRRLN
ncbi:MAG: hypothetical protein VB859_13420 [Planctomycetaceae bacterium]